MRNIFTYMKITRQFTIVCISLLGLNIFGCASFKIPAPEGPVKPFTEPVIGNSTINLPVTLSVTSLTNKINQALSRSKELKKLDQENNITGKIQDFLNKQSSHADKDILNNVYLRLTIGKAWDALQSPIRLNYDLSLFLNLQAVQISPPARQGDKAKIVVGLVARPKLVAGNVPKINVQPLPELLVTSALPENGFHIALDNALSFDFITNELTKRLEGKVYPVNGNTIIIERVRLYGAGDSVIMEVRIKGTVRGTIYLSGMPAYDESTRTLYVRNLDYTLDTKNILVKAADWLLHTGLRDGLANQAKWYVGDKIDEAKDMLSNALNRNLSQHVRIRGEITAIRPAAVGVTDASLKAVLVADGTAEMNVF